MPQPKPRTRGTSSSIFTRAINSLISIETDGDHEDAGGDTLADLAKKSISSCSIETLVSDSKFLIVDSLVELINAIVSKGNSSIYLATEGMPTDTAELALELLFSLSLRNRDRISLIWPQIHEYLEVCTSQKSGNDFTALNERAIKGLMRICQRLLPYKEDIAGMLLGSLSLIGAMHPKVVWELSPSFTAELITLLSQSAPHIRTETGWRTIAILIRISASREEVLPYSLQALQLACRNPDAITVESYIPLLETCLQLIDAFKRVNPGIAVEFLECADSLFSWLPTQDLSKDNGRGAPDTEALLDLWLTSIGILTKGLCREQSKDLRHISMAVLHRTLLASGSLNLPADMWVQTLGEMILPLVSDLSKNSKSKKNTLSEGEEVLQMAVNMLLKVLAKYVPLISGDNDFGVLWESIFNVLAECAKTSTVEIREILEAEMKNLLITLIDNDILTETWADGSGKGLWEITWEGANNISPVFDNLKASNSRLMDTATTREQSNDGPVERIRETVEISKEGMTNALLDPDKDPVSNQTEEMEPPACKQA
jgi:brefeldin A-resistance guanine nucleotide exchange factor 1